MKKPRPGSLSVQAVNQYRRRDILTYLALRFYLENSAARTDRWAREIATDLVLSRSNPVYFKSHHFKDISYNGDVDHRIMYLPCANEALAESALLAECAKYPQAFGNAPCVFSYSINGNEDRSGIFLHYSKGLRDRHQAIAQACDNIPGSVVRYIDLKKFYPSISSAMALAAWKTTASHAGIAEKWVDLGQKLLHEHASVDPAFPGLLTGPMFSHLIANLVLRPLDERFGSDSRVFYCRYVDDITLVGSRDNVSSVLREIRAQIEAAGLSAHDDHSPKSLTLSADEWLRGRDDFHDSRRSISWMTLIGDLKRFLIANPKSHDELRCAFGGAELRIPVRDYSGAIYERSFLEKFKQLSSQRWFRKKTHQVTIKSLLKQALWLRESYDRELIELLSDFERLSPYERKRRVPKIRYRAGRLSYLASRSRLSELSQYLAITRDFYLQSKVMGAISSGNISEVIRLGTNAAQAAAQPMRAGEITAYIDPMRVCDVDLQAVSVFFLNGVRLIDDVCLENVQSELLLLAKQGASPQLMRSNDLFLSEFACLHGLQNGPRHASLLESVFDEDEDLAVDAADQLGQSLSP